MINGELLDAAEAAGFDVVVTTDRNFRHQQNLTRRKIADGCSCSCPEDDDDRISEGLPELTEGPFSDPRPEPRTLALVGVFGMTAYAVSRRTAEIGVRMALGARPHQVVGTMLRDAVFPILAGTIVGIGGALLPTRMIESFLCQTPPTDPMTLATVSATLALAGCMAALIPSLRAARVDPALTLRAD